MGEELRAISEGTVAEVQIILKDETGNTRTIKIPNAKTTSGMASSASTVKNLILDSDTNIFGVGIGLNDSLTAPTECEIYRVETTTEKVI